MNTGAQPCAYRTPASDPARPSVFGMKLGRDCVRVGRSETGSGTVGPLASPGRAAWRRQEDSTIAAAADEDGNGIIPLLSGLWRRGVCRGRASVLRAKRFERMWSAARPGPAAGRWGSDFAARLPPSGVSSPEHDSLSVLSDRDDAPGSGGATTPGSAGSGPRARAVSAFTTSDSTPRRPSRRRASAPGADWSENPPGEHRGGGVTDEEHIGDDDDQDEEADEAGGEAA